LPGNAAPTSATLQSLQGRVVQFQNSGRTSTHTVVKAESENNELVLTLKDDLLLALLKVTDVKPQALVTDTALPLAGTYTNAVLSDPTFQNSFKINGIAKNSVQLAAPLPQTHGFKK